ncbi:MAG TPA: DUF3098 domain-containing protein [Cytophagales bacterium]|nr:DUF3098 domain-containing protein [Cytophagales bacterium]
MENNNNLVFGGKNYKLMLIGMATLILGFVIISMDKEEYGFGFLGLVLGPIVVMAGFIIQFFAIFAKKKS